MNEKPLYEHIFELLDYADKVAALISKDADRLDNARYFKSLVYIEDILDNPGRTDVYRSAEENGLSGREQLSEATRRMDILRNTILELRNEYDFDDSLVYATNNIRRNWLKDKNSLS